MEEKPLYVLRFATQDRATKYLNKLVQQFDEHILYTDMTEKCVEFDNEAYYFWDRLRDDGIQFVAEYDERDFQKIIKELAQKYFT